MTTFEYFKLLVDSHFGIYTPQVLCVRFSESLNLNKFCDVSILLNPKHEFYWDEFDTLLNNFEFTDENGKKWVLFANEDLWLVPEDTDFEEFII